MRLTTDSALPLPVLVLDGQAYGPASRVMPAKDDSWMTGGVPPMGAASTGMDSESPRTSAEVSGPWPWAV